MIKFPKVASIKSVEAFRKHIDSLGIDLPIDDQLASGPGSPLGNSLCNGDFVIGNRFAILPMEGWDGERDGTPTNLTRRRWRNFGISGAKLIWGGEAVAVRPDGRANPNQLMINESTIASIESLRHDLLKAHQERFSNTDDLLVGLQLTHSGRFARPNSKVVEPRTAYRHPVLDPRMDITDDTKIFTDEELDRLVEEFIAAAVLAQKAGFSFVDIKHCHGYFGHELLSGYDRPGRYGGSFENRTNFLRKIVEGIRSEAPGLEVGVRISIFDFIPFKPGDDDVGVPAREGAYAYAFGGDGTGQGIDLTETHRFMKLLKELGIRLVCSTAGSPYYNPHIQRPASFPPSDGYQPPEDPLVGVARQINATAQIKREHPELILVGSGYSYLQDWLGHVAQHVVRSGGVDSIGLGRMVLSYPDLPADIIESKPSQRKKICRTFSECTTAPRNGIVSGCYPLDPFYKAMPEAKEVKHLSKK